MPVLIVEDDHTLSQNIHEALQAVDLNPEVVYDGRIAEKMLRKTLYDCIIMDVNIPGKNGFELCREFRKHNMLTPVIMLTAFGELEDKRLSCGL